MGIRAAVWDGWWRSEVCLCWGWRWGSSTRERPAAAYLHLLEDTVEAGRLARPRSPGDVEAAGATLEDLLLQEGPDGVPLGLAGQQPVRDGGVERPLGALELGLCRKNKGDAWRIRLQRPHRRRGGTHLCRRHASLLGARRGFGVLGSCGASPVAVVTVAPAGGEPRPENSHPSSAFGATPGTLCFAWGGTPTGRGRGCSRCRLLGDKTEEEQA